MCVHLRKYFCFRNKGSIFLGQGCDVIRNQFFSIQISLRRVLVCDLLIDYGDQICNFVPLVFSERADSLGYDEY